MPSGFVTTARKYLPTGLSICSDLGAGSGGGCAASFGAAALLALARKKRRSDRASDSGLNQTALYLI
jgi:hypothetical protein